VAGTSRKTTRCNAAGRAPPRAKTVRRMRVERKLRDRKSSRYWSAGVTKKSDAFDLEGGVFTWRDPKRIAASVKRSAQASHRRKADPYRSALSMLVFYINRAGKNLSATRRRALEKAKTELRRQFGRE
jgi:Protein of unknown function (DUF3175)